MKFISMEMRFDNWFIDLLNIDGVAGFADVPFKFQVVLRRLVFSAEIAQKYDLPFEDLPEGIRGGNAETISLGYGDTARAALNNLFDIVDQSDTPEKSQALSAISGMMQIIV